MSTRPALGQKQTARRNEMRAVILAGLLLVPGGVVGASEAKTSCEAQAAMVMEVVTGRVEGKRQKAAERKLRKALGRDAAELLAAWVYSLPEEHLTEEVGTAWQAQCESL
jgi:hypothetical protein